MKCTTCGQTLSLRMMHCSICGTPTPHSAPKQASGASYEQPRYTQPPQYGQNGGMNYADATGPAAQAAYIPSSPIQQPLPVDYYLSAQTHAVSLPASTTYDTMQQIKKRRRRSLFLVAIVVCVLLLFAISAYKLLRIANATSTVKQANTPSGNARVPSASVILKDAQTSSAIDNTLASSQITKTFMANQKVYVTFTITSGKLNGFIEAKWYADGLIVASTVLPHTHENTHGVFSNAYITATPDGAVELYWCIQSDCRDAQLAQVVHFIVTPVATAYVRIRLKME